MKTIGGIRTYQDACVFDYKFRKDTPHKWIIKKITEHEIKQKVCR
jgi:hypothetical protein